MPAIIISVVGLAAGYTLWGMIALLGVVPAVTSFLTLRHITRTLEVDGDTVSWTPYLGRRRSCRLGDIDSYCGVQTMSLGARQIRFTTHDGQSFVVPWRLERADEAIRLLISGSGAAFRYPTFWNRLVSFWHGTNQYYRRAEIIPAFGPAVGRRSPRRRTN